MYCDNMRLIINLDLYWYPFSLQKVKKEGAYDHSLDGAKAQRNKNLNRYRDVLPYDHSRIKLQNTENDYINASLVKVS